jgi:hypothetical protein
MKFKIRRVKSSQEVAIAVLSTACVRPTLGNEACDTCTALMSISCLQDMEERDTLSRGFHRTIPSVANVNGYHAVLLSLIEDKRSVDTQAGDREA